MVMWARSSVQNLYTPTANRKANVGLFMSGSGTNVVKVLEYEIMLGSDSPFHGSVVITDNPESNAEEIAKESGIECICLDIYKHYRDSGLKKVSIKTVEGQRARREYTEELWKKIRPLSLDFAVFGGFEPLTNITNYLPCLNVHPGDLTYLKDGERLLVGLHTVPIQRALDEGINYVRSSVILAMPYTGAGENMDDGAILALGPKLVYGEERNAKKIQNRLKEVSDWKVLPITVEEVAKGNVVVDFETNKAYHHKNGTGIVIPETGYIK